MAEIYHITARTAWENTADLYKHPSLEQEGFIHFSTANQVAQTANRFYHDQDDLILLCVDTGLLNAEVRWVYAPDRREKFPHVHGPVQREAVRRVLPLTRDENGDYTLPDKL